MERTKAIPKLTDDQKKTFIEGVASMLKIHGGYDDSLKTLELEEADLELQFNTAKQLRGMFLSVEGHPKK